MGRIFNEVVLLCTNNMEKYPVISSYIDKNKLHILVMVKKVIYNE